MTYGQGIRHFSVGNAKPIPNTQTLDRKLRRISHNVNVFMDLAAYSPKITRRYWHSTNHMEILTL